MPASPADSPSIDTGARRGRKTGAQPRASFGSVSSERTLIGIGVLAFAAWSLWMAAFGRRWYQFPYEERTRKELEQYGWSGGWRPVQRRDRIVGAITGVVLLCFAVSLLLDR